MNDQEIREAIIRTKALIVAVKKLGEHSTKNLIDEEDVRSIKKILALAQSYLSIKMPREKEYIFPRDYKNNDKNCEIVGYNQALKDCKLFFLKQMEGLELQEAALLHWKILMIYLRNI